MFLGEMAVSLSDPRGLAVSIPGHNERQPGA